MSRSEEFAAGTGQPQDQRYTVVSFHGPAEGKPRMMVRSRHEYDEDAVAAAQHIADNDSTAWPNRDYPSKHPKHGELSTYASSYGNRMAAIYNSSPYGKYKS